MTDSQASTSAAAPVFREGVGKEQTIYTARFSESEDQTRLVTWKILCAQFFQRWISVNETVLDLGAGDGLFITNIKAKRRIAVDLSPHLLALESQGIEVCLTPATELCAKIKDPVDVVFMSNFLEHMPDKHTLLKVLEECFKILKPGGKVLILQPNIRYVGPAYWDYIDHHIALTEHSLTEALRISGFTVETLIPRFLPYTVRSGAGHVARGSAAGTLVTWYLKLPFLWRIFGQQTFVVAQKKG